MKVPKRKKAERVVFFSEVRWWMCPPCPNCGEKGAHFAPPSLGDEGFFICKPRKAE